MGSQLLAERGPVGVVSMLKLAVQHQLKQRAMLALAALFHCSELQGRDACYAGVAKALAEAMADAWPGDTDVCGLALCAAVHARATGEHGAIPTLLDAALGCLERHGSDLALTQAGLRFLRKQTSLEQEPRLAAVVAKAMLTHRQDQAVHFYGGWIFLLLHAVEPKEIAAKHGELGMAAVVEKTIQVAAGGTMRTVLVDGVPWQDFVLTKLYPRLRGRS